MKKILFSVAMVAMVASCAKNEAVDVPSTNAIGFSTLNDRVVAKSANDATTAVDYAVYSISGDNTSVWFISDVITGTTDVAAKGPYYWPTSGCAVDFYAYAPSTSSNITEGTVLATTPAIPLSYTVPAGAQEDFTVATPVNVTEGSYTGDNSPSTVDFTFNHMLAKVSVQIALTEDFANTHFISDGTVENYTSTDNEEYTDAPFTATLTPVYDTFTVDAVDAEVATTSTAAGDVVAHSGYTSFYIAPQAFADCTLQINNITVRNKETGATFFPSGISVDLTKIILTGEELNTDGTDETYKDAFAAGTHYVFTVYIDGTSTEEGKDKATQILFSATTASWGDAVAGTLTQE